MKTNENNFIMMLDDEQLNNVVGGANVNPLDNTTSTKDVTTDVIELPWGKN